MPSGKKGSYIDFLNPSRPDPGRREKINLNFFFLTLLCGASKGFMMTWKGFYFNFILFNFLKCKGRDGLIDLWHRCVVVITTAQLHSTKVKKSGSPQVQTLLAVCRWFAVVRISDDGHGWEEG